MSVLQGQISLAYVVEIVTKAWDCDDARNENAVGAARLSPLHEDETGTVYIRKQASTMSVGIFTHLKLWIASARHNFKWVKIPITEYALTYC